MKDGLAINIIIPVLEAEPCKCPIPVGISIGMLDIPPEIQ